MAHSIPSVCVLGYSVRWNLPGYMPDSEPLFCLTWDEAKSALMEELVGRSFNEDSGGSYDNAIQELDRCNEETYVGSAGIGFIAGGYYFCISEFQQEINIEKLIVECESRAKGKTPEPINRHYRAEIELECGIELKSVTLPHHTSGDYGGSGSLAHANRASLFENEWATRLENGGILVRVSGDYSSEWINVAALAWGLPNNEIELIALAQFLEYESVEDEGSADEMLSDDIGRLQEWIRELDRYPVADEEKMSEIEMEWQSEAWENYTRGDFKKECESKLADSILDEISEDDDAEEIACKYLESLSEIEVCDLFRAMAEKSNTYWECDYNSANIDERRIVERAFDVLSQSFRDWRALELDRARGTVGHPELPFPA